MESFVDISHSHSAMFPKNFYFCKVEAINIPGDHKKPVFLEIRQLTSHPFSNSTTRAGAEIIDQFRFLKKLKYVVST